jgi:hypothetical protein
MAQVKLSFKLASEDETDARRKAAEELRNQQVADAKKATGCGKKDCHDVNFEVE